MNRLFLRWIALFLFAVAGACSRAPEEAEVAIPDKGKKAKATAVKTFDAPRDPPVRPVDEETEQKDEVTTVVANEEAKSPSPENIKGRQQEMAEDILAMPEGEARALALAELVRRWGRSGSGGCHGTAGPD